MQLRPAMRPCSPSVTRVLVTGAGGPSAVSFMRAADGDGVEFYAADVDPYAPGLYMVPPGRRVILPRGDDPGFVTSVLSVCRTHQIEVVVPTVDTELLPLASKRWRLEAAGTRLLLAPKPALAVCLDKWALVRAMDLTVPIPRTSLVEPDFDWRGWALPVILKPRSGSGSNGVRLIERREQLDTALGSDWVVQEYLPGREFSLDVLTSVAGEVRAVVPRERLKLDSGIAITSRTVHDERLELIGRRAVELTGLTAVANVQVREDALGTPRLLEINPRFPGTMSLTVASGVNMPKLALGELLGRPLPAGELRFREIAIVRYLEEIVVDVAELRELESRAEGGLRSRVGSAAC